MTLTPRAVTFFLACFLNLILAGFIGWQYRKRRIARLYALTAFFAAGYSWLTGGLAAAATEKAALLWFRAFFPLTCFVVVSIYHFAIVYSRQEKPWTRAVLRLGYLYAAAISLVKVFDLAPGRMVRHADLSWFPDQDPFYFHFYGPFFLAFFFLSLGLVAARLAKSGSTRERNNLKYFLAAAGSLFLITQANLVSSVSFLGSFDMVSYSAILAYAVSQRRLFELSLILRSGAVAAGLLFLLCLLFVLSLAGVRDLFSAAGPEAQLAALLGVTVLLTILFDPVKDFFRGHLHRLFKVRVLSPTERILDYALFFSQQHRLPETLTSLCTKLAADMDLVSVRVVFKDRASEDYSVRASQPAGPENEGPLPQAATGPLAARLAQAPGGLDLEEVVSDFEEAGSLDAASRDTLATALRTLEAQVAIPIFTNGALEGFLLLGPKASGALFTDPERTFLSALAVQVAVALESSRLAERLQQADKLSLLGTMAASVAHEIRNPLTSLMLYVDVAASKIQDEPFKTNFSSQVPNELRKLKRLTDELLTFARPSSGKAVQVDVQALVQSMQNLVRYQFLAKKVVLEVEPGGGGPAHTLGDEAQLSQVLMNLMLNALHATEAGGKVSVKVARPAESFLTLTVEDSGCGMQPGQASRIFEPFYTTKNSGTGLGLATCQRVVMDHGGAITVASEPGKGSTFTVRLPSASAAAPPALSLQEVR